jgi:4-amino-4-deoxy-L-arabinose transferase-like glycosyltransferase
LCVQLVYSDGALLLESLLVTEFLLIWLTFLRYRKNESFAYLLLCGFVAGLAIVTRPNAVVLPVICLAMILLNKDLAGKSRVRNALIYVFVVTLPITAVLTHNLTREEPAFTIATQGGINFYLGNNNEADGVSAVMPGPLGYNWQYEDIEYLAESQTGKQLTPPEVSAFYYKKGLDESLESPTRWRGRLLRKVFLFYSGFDISNNRNLIAFKSQFETLKLLPLGMAILGPLGLIGMVLAWSRNKTSSGVALSVVVYSLTFALFFVNSRFRLPLLPILAVFTAYLLLELLDHLRRKSIVRVAAIVVPAVILLGILNTNIYNLDFENSQQASFSRGNLALEIGNTEEAVRYFRDAISEESPLK